MRKSQLRDSWNFYTQWLIKNTRQWASSLWSLVNSENPAEPRLPVDIISFGAPLIIYFSTSIEMLGLSSNMKQLVKVAFGIMGTTLLMTQLVYDQTNALQIDQELQKLLSQIGPGSQQKRSLPQTSNRSSLVFNQNSENDWRFRVAGFNPNTVPKKLKCPFSDQIFTYPVILKDSKVGEVGPIEITALCDWLTLTGKVLNMKALKMIMKNLKMDMKLLRKAEDFVESKVVRIKNLLIYSSWLFATLERKECSIIAAGYAVIVLGHDQSSSSKNLVISAASLNTWTPQIPKKITETVFAYCGVNFFGKSHYIAVENLNPQSCRSGGASLV